MYLSVFIWYVHVGIDLEFSNNFFYLIETFYDVKYLKLCSIYFEWINIKILGQKITATYEVGDNIVKAFSCRTGLLSGLKNIGIWDCFIMLLTDKLHYSVSVF